MPRRCWSNLALPIETRVVSAHRTPDLLFEYAAAAEGRAEGDHRRGRGAAHLPGSAAPRRRCRSSACRWNRVYCDSVDSLLSIVQMPKGIPVGTLAIGPAGAANAALLAAASWPSVTRRSPPGSSSFARNRRGWSWMPSWANKIGAVNSFPLAG